MNLGPGVVAQRVKLQSASLAFHNWSAGLSPGCYTSSPAPAGKAVEGGPSGWTSAIHVGPGGTYRLLASAWTSSGHCKHLGSKPVDGSPLSVSPSLFLKIYLFC